MTSTTGPLHTLPPADSMRTKGTPLKAVLAWVEHERGPDGVERLLEGIDPEHRRLMGKTVLPSSWYPLTVLVDVLGTADRLFGRGTLSVCHDIGRWSSDYEVTLLHKVFLKLASLDYWLKGAASMWTFYYGAGKMKAEVRKGGGTITLADFNPLSKAFCLRFEGWVERTVELSKHERVRVRHTECVLDGKPACVFEGTWRT